MLIEKVICSWTETKDWKFLLVCIWLGEQLKVGPKRLSFCFTFRPAVLEDLAASTVWSDSSLFF